MPVPLLRTSERVAFKRCPQRWWWSYREGLRPIGQPSNPLWFGTGWHLALALWYKPGKKRGVDPRETWKKYCEDEIRFVKSNATTWEGDKAETKVAEYTEATELGLGMFDGYLERFGNDDSWDVLAPEQTFQVLIPDPANPKQALIEYDGTFDGAYIDEDDGRLKLMEHKTAAAISTKHLSLDDQAGSYWAIATNVLRHQGLIRPKQTLAGITYNFARKAKPDPRPMNADGLYLNKDGSVSKTQGSPRFVREFITRTAQERRTQIQRIQNEALAMEAFREGDLPLYKNPTKDCSWDCDFFDMCELQESSSDWEDFRDAMFRVEDPYKDHRKAA